MRRIAILAISLIAVLAACDERESPTGLKPDASIFAKGSRDTDPRAVWEFSSQFVDGSEATQTSGIIGDGRGAYQGDVCGVHAKIFVSNGGGDAVIDPDQNYSRKNCPAGARYFQFVLSPDQTVRAGAFTNVLGAWDFAPGETREQPIQFRYTNIPACEVLRFESANGLSPVRVTRTDDGDSAAPRKWAVESLPPHTAGCYNWVQGAYVFTGPTFTLPFKVSITQVL